MLPATQWKPGAGLTSHVIKRLLDDPSRFDFFQAVRLLAAWLIQQGMSHEQVFEHCLRLHGSTSLSFAASEIEQLWLELSDTDEMHVHLQPAMTGFLGVHGSLPLHYTEMINRVERQTGDDGPRAWLDTLSQRALGLFYQAWARYRIECQADADGGDFLQLQLALAGSWPAQLAQQPDGLPAHVHAHYAAMLRHRPATAEVMQSVLAEYFEVPVQLQRWIGDWFWRAPQEHSLLATANCLLGRGAMLGERCRRADLRVRLVLGPLARAAYDDFLPGRPGALALRQMLALFGLPSVSIEVRLVLRREAVRGCVLGMPVGLGHDTFLLTTPPQHDRDDMAYDIRFDGSA
ncbi:MULTISPECIES: type VI secretion system baseplate subunit TssG [unclassified Janthinobacterium]|uniref:type VI secretion system baseplate subunit TssG n=1 Tax=unclassified Janthinobacterium TaxID=2610881 RepID=UPI00161D0B94|nr:MULTISPECIES: type VI secretion system baseplate subunit TssG [unclassified Janthinobacterium]MBB5610084.1 type VI secretion system protein ImpH [Janthinobacterium sp. S3T4]MBB5615282.1 type VI secretion system protein ImpH [Janthinobacterium sp. S3M3]